MCLTGFGAVSFDGHAFFQLVDGLLCDLSVHLSQISAWMLKFRVKQFLDEFSVVGKEQGSLAVVVKTASSINAGWEPKFIQCPMPCFGGKLAKYAKRLVEQNHHCL